MQPSVPLLYSVTRHTHMNSCTLRYTLTITHTCVLMHLHVCACVQECVWVCVILSVSECIWWGVCACDCACVSECARVCVLVCKNVSESVCVWVSSESEGQEGWKQVSSTPLAACHEQPQASSRQGQLRSNFVRWWKDWVHQFSHSTARIPALHWQFVLRRKNTTGTHAALILSRQSNSKRKTLKCSRVLPLLTQLLQPFHLFHFWQPLKSTLAEEISTTKATMTVLSSETPFQNALGSEIMHFHAALLRKIERNWRRKNPKK